MANNGTPRSTVTKAPYETGALATPRRAKTSLRAKQNAELRAMTAPIMAGEVHRAKCMCIEHAFAETAFRRVPDSAECPVSRQLYALCPMHYALD